MTEVIDNRRRRAIELRQFLPNAEFVNKEIIAKGKGTKVALGRIYGVVSAIEERVDTDRSGHAVTHIAATGAFKSLNYLSGEEGMARSAFFPEAFAKALAAKFDAAKRRTGGTDEAPTFVQDPLMIEVDCDVSLEATGKNVPVEWIITVHTADDDMDILAGIGASRDRPATAPALATVEGDKGVDAKA